LAEYLKITAIVASALSLLIVDRIFIVAVPSMFIAFAAYLLGRRNADSPKNSELINFISSIQSNYKRSGSLRLAIERAAASSYTFSPLLSRLLRSYAMGGKFYYAEMRMSRTGSEAQKSPLGELLAVLSEGLEGGSNIVNQLSFLKQRLESEEEERNTVASKVESMSAVSKMGIMFFFPVFSGISSAIIGSTASMMHGSALIGMKLGEISIAYIIAISVINSFFSNYDANAETVAYKAMPTVVTAAILFFFTSNFLAKMI